MATALTTKRDALWTEANALLKTAEDAKRNLLPEEEQRFDALKAEMDAITRTVDRVKQADEWTPPVPAVATDRAAADDAEVRVLGRDESVRSWVEAHTAHPREFGSLRLGDVLRAMITGPRNDLEKRALAAGTDSAGGYTVPDILMAPWIDRLRAALVVVRAGAVTVPLTSDTVKIARLLTDPTAAWRSENAAVAESGPRSKRSRSPRARSMCSSRPRASSWRTRSTSPRSWKPRWSDRSQSKWTESVWPGPEPRRNPGGSETRQT
jgi:HK97 family phage major capsid protein